MRFTEEERALLKLLEGALDISEYTDKVDVSSDRLGFGIRWGSKGSIMKEELNDFLTLISGLLLAGVKNSKSKILMKSFNDNADLFRAVFELGRRYKISNCDKMRTTYGKLLHILQDAVSGVLDFKPCIDIKTVGSLLKERGIDGASFLVSIHTVSLLPFVTSVSCVSIIRRLFVA